MFKISNTKQSLAALAIFKRLYNNGKDIFQVISEFEKYLILRDHMLSFTTVSMEDSLKKDFGIEVPLSIIKAGLRRLDFVIKGTTDYSLKDTHKNQEIEEFKDDVQNLNNKNDDIFQELISFVESKKGKALNEEEIKELSNAFYSHVLNTPYPDDYAGYVSAFFINHDNDQVFIQRINDIMGGAIIIAGLNYNTTDSQIDSVDTPIFMYLETEILFHMAGYNGKIYKRLFDEFYSLVEEINKKYHKQIIQLFYFEETKDEFEKYFQAAENIVRNNSLAQAGQTAMINIVSGCHEASDVADKKAIFYRELENHNISLDEQRNYYDRENYELNIEDGKYIDNEDPDGSADKVSSKMKLLNFIHIKRGGRGRSIFRNIGHLIITGNSITFKIANDPGVVGNDLPLAFSLSYITNRLWFSLHKNLVGDNVPISASIINRSIIILDREARKALVNDYRNIKQAHDSGEVNDKDVFARLAQYRDLPTSIDDLTNSENAEEVLDFITNSSLQSYIEERDAEKQSAEEKAKLAEKAIDELYKGTIEDAIKTHRSELKYYRIVRNKSFRQSWIYAILKSIGSLFLLLVLITFLVMAGILGVIGLNKGETPYWLYIFSLFVIAIVSCSVLVPIGEYSKKILNSIKAPFTNSGKRKLRKKICAEFLSTHNSPRLKLPTREQVEASLMP